MRAHYIPFVILSLLLAGMSGCAMAGSAKTYVEASLEAFPGHVHIRELCKLTNLQIDESSGLAFSKRNPSVLWTHNDSGDMPRIFAFGLDGRDLATFEIAGAKAVDWEDMSSVQIGSTSYLLMADVGDNWRSRDEYTIYMVEEPLVEPSQKPEHRVLSPSRKIPFRYEDGPKNCESVAMDPRTNTIYLVTKNMGWTCAVYTLSASEIKEGEIIVARAIATLNLHRTTAMDISPDGRRAVVLTYGDAYEFLRNPGERWAEAFSREPLVIPMPKRPRGESICYGPDGITLYLTSEKTPTPLWEVRRFPAPE